MIKTIDEAINKVGSEDKLISLINHWLSPDRMIKVQFSILHKDGTIYLESYFNNTDEVHWFIDNLSNVISTPITFSILDY